MPDDTRESTLNDIEETFVAKRDAALGKARDSALPARYRETFAVRAEVYQEILDAADALRAE